MAGIVHSGLAALPLAPPSTGSGVGAHRRCRAGASRGLADSQRLTIVTFSCFHILQLERLSGGFR